MQRLDEKRTLADWVSVFACGIILLISFVAFYQLQQQQEASEQRLLDEKLRSAEQLFSQWFQQQKRQINTWSRYSVVSDTSVALAGYPLDRRELIGTPTQLELRQFFSPLLKMSKIDSFMLIDRRGWVRAASDNRMVAASSPIVEYPALFAPLWQGSNQWLLPYINPHPTSDDQGVFRAGQPHLFIAAPVSHGLDITSVLVFTINLQRELLTLLEPLRNEEGLYLKLVSKEQPLAEFRNDLVLKDADAVGRVIARRDHDYLPVSFYMEKRYLKNKSFSAEQLILLTVGSLAMMALVSLLVYSARRKNYWAGGVADHYFPLREEDESARILLAADSRLLAASPHACELIAGDQAAPKDMMTVLLTECALSLNDDNGRAVGGLSYLLVAEEGQCFFTWWAAGDQRRLLEFSRTGDNEEQGVSVCVRDVTRTRSEFLRLRRKNDALNEAADLVLWVGQNGNLVDANISGLKKLGYTEQDLQGVTLGDIDASFSAESWHSVWSRIRRGETVEQEGHFIRRNGIPFPADIVIRLQPESFEEYACVYVRDITKRKRLEADLYRKRALLTEKLSVTAQELEAREAENDALIEALPDLLVIFNAQLNILGVQQPKGEALTFDFVMGDDIASVFPQLSNEMQRRELTDSLNSEAGRYFTEIRQEAEHGSLTLELRFARTGTNKVLLLVRDITARKMIEYFRQFNNRLLTNISQMQTQFICTPEKSLPELPDQLASLVDIAQVDSGFYWVNDSLQRRMGCPPQGCFFNTTGNEPDKETVSAVFEAIRKVVAHWLIDPGAAQPVITAFRDLPVQTEPLLPTSGVLFLPVTSLDRPVICFALLMPDIRPWVSESALFTPWLSTVAALLSAYESETERQWAEQSMQFEKERAEKASQAKTEFLSRMSHEFRTPLNAILGFSQLMQLDDTLTDEHAEQVTQIVNSGQAMLELVDGVLDLARLEQNQLTLELTQVSLGEVVTSCLTELIGDIERADLKLDISFPDEDVAIQADERRLRQVIQVLLKNAISYTPAGGAVTLKYRFSSRYCELSVQDTGRGIPEEFLEKIFMPFEAADGYINAEGMGNGLAVANHISQAMGGRISVRSEVDIGSEFTLILPVSQRGGADELHVEAPGMATSAEQIASGDIAESPDRSAETPMFVSSGTSDVQSAGPAKSAEEFRVLHIEDDETNRRLFSRLIEHINPDIAVTSAASVSTGIDAFLSSQPSLIFVDMNLVGGSGTDVLEAVRQETGGVDLPVVAVSGNVSEASIEEALDKGFDDYLCKPVSLEALSAVIERYRS